MCLEKTKENETNTINSYYPIPLLTAHTGTAAFNI